MAVSHNRRSAGEGSVYRTGDGRWRAAYLVTDPSTGSQSRRFLSGRTRADVVRKLDGLKRDASTGNLAGETTAQYLARWLDGRHSIRPSSWRQREQYVRSYIAPALGHLRLAKLTPADVERMTSNLISSGKSPRTAAAVRVILRRALGDAVRDGLLGRNVAALARPPRVPTRSMEQGRDYLSSDHLRRLLDAVRDEPLGPLVTVAATTGMRQGELLGLRWHDVDTQAGTLHVQRALARAWNGGWELAEPKTNRSRRMLNLPAAATAALDRQRGLQAAMQAEAGTAWQDRHGLIFTDELGRPLNGRNVTRAFSAMLDDAGLPHIPFHGLRHSVATALLAAGVPLRVVSDVLGHTTLTVTADIYASVVPELRREAADAMDKVLG
ncbi:site-specific integrase [soil metagenome]